MGITTILFGLEPFVEPPRAAVRIHTSDIRDRGEVDMRSHTVRSQLLVDCAMAPNKRNRTKQQNLETDFHKLLLSHLMVDPRNVVELTRLTALGEGVVRRTLADLLHAELVKTVDVESPGRAKWYLASAAKPKGGRVVHRAK